ncbi:MAG: hypothetical protein ACK5LL_07325 [Suipraeoptans sp.]
MEERMVISSHELLTDYSMKAKIKRVIVGWIIFLAIFGATRVPDVQLIMTDFADKMQVSWLSSVIDFIIRGLWIGFIPMITGTFITLRTKQIFTHIAIYEEDLALVNRKLDTCLYIPYGQVKLSYGRMQESFYMDFQDKNLKKMEYAWSEFTSSDVLRNNLERYGRMV